MLAVRRRTRVFGAFPDGESAVMLVSVRPRQVVSTQWGTRKYMPIAWLKHQDMEAFCIA
jgi:putative transposase